MSSTTENHQSNNLFTNQIQFDFSETEEPHLKSWCTSSGDSSCCSLCRLNEDGEETMFEDLGSEALSDLVLMSSAGISFPSRPSDGPAAATGGRAPGPRRKCPCSLFQTCGSCAAAPSSNPAGFASKVFDGSSPLLSPSRRSSLRSLLFSGPPVAAPPLPQPDLLTAGFLPEDSVYSILSFLDVPTLVEVRSVNSKMKRMASDDNAGWKTHCSALWEKKVRVCRDARRLLDRANGPEDGSARTSAMEAYKTSIFEAGSVNELTEEDLCFDLDGGRKGVEWSFRFKQSAGLDWTSWDPWWKNGPARRLVFLRSGAILQSHPPGRSPLLITHAGTPLYDVFSERLVLQNNREIIPPRIEMKWRFVEASVDLPRRPDGAYVRITVGGRDVPTYVVRRSPNGNWGFIMESCWGLYASFGLAPRIDRRPRSEPSDDARRALRRTRNGTRWVDVDESDSETADENERRVRRRADPDMGVEESAMTVTGVSQWREALLYNIGAVTLPEGNNALNQFDTAWQNALLLR